MPVGVPGAAHHSRPSSLAPSPPRRRAYRCAGSPVLSWASVPVFSSNLKVHYQLTDRANHREGNALHTTGSARTITSAHGWRGAQVG